MIADSTTRNGSKVRWSGDGTEPPFPSSSGRHASATPMLASGLLQFGDHLQEGRIVDRLHEVIVETGLARLPTVFFPPPSG